MKADNDNQPSLYKRAKPLPILTADDRGRFSTFVDKSGGPDACWPWTGTADPYGRFKAQGRALQAHRVAYSIEHDDLLEDAAVVRHTCDNPPCCNPAHLVPGNYLDNAVDMMSRNRQKPVRGEAHPRAAANDNLARDILESPLSGRKAAEHFDVSYGMVANIRARRTWKHVA